MGLAHSRIDAAAFVDFTATNVAFANNASNYNHSAAGQSLALYLNADRAALDGCALLGGQDTLCATCWAPSDRRASPPSPLLTRRRPPPTPPPLQTRAPVACGCDAAL